eukprot:9475551-Pyramimonas_sp.AAC.1
MLLARLPLLLRSPRGPRRPGRLVLPNGLLTLPSPGEGPQRPNTFKKGPLLFLPGCQEGGRRDDG